MVVYTVNILYTKLVDTCIHYFVYNNLLRVYTVNILYTSFVDTENPPRSGDKILAVSRWSFPSQESPLSLVS